MKSSLLFELLQSTWAIRESSRVALEMVANRIMNDPTFTIDPAVQQSRFHAGTTPGKVVDGINPFDQLEPGSVAIIPIEGVMVKNGGWYWTGMNDVARLLQLANESSSVTGVVIKADTPGGSVDSVFILQDVISRFTKPIVTFTDGNLCSAGLWSAVFTDAIYALNEMNVVGSIGVMTTLTDFSGMYKEWGIVSRSIYPPESKFKNLPYREATRETPDDTRIIEEVLSPLAIKFQDTVRAGRPNLNKSVEGILEGKEFYAGDALKLGMLDGIASLDQVVSIVKNEFERRLNIVNM